ncbi:type VII secretion integral membrane protein EccD [Bifidobacterium stellenboschense]|uniref:type VII secretion integral membrane protein EccD n=1 Tax=Bifidobacterium stellenboschense TaxID=762211 RepID=UPI00055183E7|nr:type VII secretion integral membrane protein EccD [Bifidobacterium stellenboschense]
MVVRVSYGRRSTKISLPATQPVAELLPNIAKRLGVLDPTLVYAGYRLLREDETPIDNPPSLAEQGVRDGDRLTLRVNALDDQDVVYDDVVEAVADSVSRAHRPWTNENTTWTSLIVSCVLLGVGAACLAFAPRSVINAVIAGLAAVAALAIGGVLASRRMNRQALALSMTACALAGVSGYQLMGALFDVPFYGLPALGAGIGLMVSGAFACLTMPATRIHATIPTLLGLIVTVLGALCAIFPQWSGRVWIAAVALTGLAATALPWLSLSASRLSVDSPTSESEIFALPKTIDAHEVRRRYRFGSSLLFDLRAATGAIIVFGVPMAVSGRNVAGLLLTFALFAAMLLDSRRIYARSEMLLTVVMAGVGICLACAACARSHPEWTSYVIGMFCVCALLCVIATQITKRDSIAMTRLADTANVVCVVATLPLAYLAMGL